MQVRIDKTNAIDEEGIYRDRGNASKFVGAQNMTAELKSQHPAGFVGASLTEHAQIALDWVLLKSSKGLKSDPPAVMHTAANSREATESCGQSLLCITKRQGGFRPEPGRERDLQGETAPASVWKRRHKPRAGHP